MTKSLHTDAYARFVAALTSARRESKFTQQEIARRLGKPQSYVAKIEGGERRLDVVELIALARALEIDPKELFANVLDAVDG